MTQPKLLTIGAAVGTVATYVIAMLVAGADLAWLLLVALVLLLWSSAMVTVWRGLASAALVMTVGAAVAGILIELAPLLMVVVVVLALTAWQLHHIAWRFEQAEHIEGEARLMGRMLSRLALFGALSMGLAAVPLLIELEVTFLMGVILGLLTLFVLSRVVRTLTKEEETA